MTSNDGGTWRSSGSIYTGEFWAEAGDRAIKSAAAAVLAKVGDDVMGLYDLGWDLAWKLAVAYTVISIAGSLVSAPFGRRRSASVL